MSRITSRASRLATVLLAIAGVIAMRAHIVSNGTVYLRADGPLECCKYDEVDRDLIGNIWTASVSFDFPFVKKWWVVITRNHNVKPKQGACLGETQCGLATKGCGVEISLDVFMNAPGLVTDTWVFWGHGALVNGTQQQRISLSAGPLAAWTTLKSDVTAFCHGDGVNPPPHCAISGGEDIMPDALGLDFIEVEFHCDPSCDY